jgi:hypothetical protein
MTKEISKRRRKVDVEKIPANDVESVGEALGKKIAAITDKAAEEVNKLTEIYGLQAKVAIQLIDAKTGETVT